MRRPSHGEAAKNSMKSCHQSAVVYEASSCTTKDSGLGFRAPYLHVTIKLLLEPDRRMQS